MKHKIAALCLIVLFVAVAQVWAAGDVRQDGKSFKNGTVEKSVSPAKENDNAKPGPEAVEKPAEARPAEATSAPVKSETENYKSPAEGHSFSGVPLPLFYSPPLSRQPQGGGDRGDHGGYSPRGGNHPHNDYPGPRYGDYRQHYPGWHWRSYHPGHDWYFWAWPQIIYVPYAVTLDHSEYFPHRWRGVYVHAVSGDLISSSFEVALREELSNEDLSPVDRPEDASLQIYVAGIDQDPENPGRSSTLAISYVWHPDDRFITTQMVNLTSDRIDELAQSVAGYADELIGYYH